MHAPPAALRPHLFPVTAIALFGVLAPALPAAADTETEIVQPAGLLFYLSADQGTTADFSAGGTPEPTFEKGIRVIPDGATGPALECANTQLLAWRAPGNIYAQRGTLSFFWRSREPVGPTEFPIFRASYADHSSWDMTWLRIDYNGHGFDAFVTDASLARTRVSCTLPKFPGPSEWIHIAFSWDETRGVRLHVNGAPAAGLDATAVYDAALDQFGPHSRIISPYQVQSAYNFVRGGDIDEIRIYDRMLDDGAIAALARRKAPAAQAAGPARPLDDLRWRGEWLLRNGWSDPAALPPALPDGPSVGIRKVEIHNAWDLKRWWGKATDGIRETTWPGVYNRSRLPGRTDYFILPDWDCYSLSGKSITFEMPAEPWNQIEISGAAFGTMTLLPGPGARPAVEKELFKRPAGRERTVHRLPTTITGGRLRFDNDVQETPIGELSAFNITAADEPAGIEKLGYRLTAAARPDNPCLDTLVTHINNRFPADERTIMVAQPAGTPAQPGVEACSAIPALPVVHILVPCSWGNPDAGLDGIALDLPAIGAAGEALLPMNIRVDDPLWPGRNMMDVSFSLKPGAPLTLWLDLRDRLLPQNRSLHLILSGADARLSPAALEGTELRLVFKPRSEALMEHQQDRFTQARNTYNTISEEWSLNRAFTRNLGLYNRFEAELTDLLRANPDHEPGRSYWSIYNPEQPRPPFVQPAPPDGVPLWAFRQVEAMGCMKQFILWYINNRQIENGEFGGGLSDDTDLTNIWPGAALMGCEPDVIADSLLRMLDACYAQRMIVNGLPSLPADELHGFEEGFNALGQALLLKHGSPRLLERAMEAQRAVTDRLTAVNDAGHRHIRTAYYSATRVSTDGVWGWCKTSSHLMLQPGLLLVDYNGSPAAKKALLELADGLLAHRRQERDGTFATRTVIEFATDRDGPSELGRVWFLFWGAWLWTGDSKYLLPIEDGGAEMLSTLNADALDMLGRRSDWGRAVLAEAQATLGNHPLLTRETNLTPLYIAWQMSGDKRFLEDLYGCDIETAALYDYINTVGSPWIDRTFIPNDDLQRARLGGVALVRNAVHPGHTVSWSFTAPATEDSVAILFPRATPADFTVLVYNLEEYPVRAAMTGWNIAPGVWEITQGIDTDGDDAADSGMTTSTLPFERSRSLDFTFPPRATTVLSFKLKTPGVPYWQRPDLGIDPCDVTVADGAVHVRVHSLGGIEAPAADVAVRDRTGRVLATARTPALPPPADLLPKTADIVIPLPADADLSGASVVIDPDALLNEITVLNNEVRL